MVFFYRRLRQNIPIPQFYVVRKERQKDQGGRRAWLQARFPKSGSVWVSHNTPLERREAIREKPESGGFTTEQKWPCSSLPHQRNLRWMKHNKPDRLISFCMKSYATPGLQYQRDIAMHAKLLHVTRVSHIWAQAQGQKRCVSGNLHLKILPVARLY